MRFRLLHIALFALIPFVGIAQTNNINAPNYQLILLEELPQKGADIHHETRLLNYFNLGDDFSFKKSYDISSPYAQHLTYKQYYKDKQILFTSVKMHIKLDGSVILQANVYANEVADYRPDMEYLLPTSKGLVSVNEVEVPHDVYPRTTYIDGNNNTLFEKFKYKYYKDTTAKAQVYMVNPINTANTSYGGNYIDNGDQSNSSLDSQRVWVDLNLNYEDDSFRLESKFMFLKEISFPFEAPFNQISDTFSFNRGEQGFEAVNTYYHINEYAKYIESLGYSSIVDTLGVDVHAFGGADNSAYDPDNHTLQFGEGGVDDAEDGEVIIHEFVHSLSELASPDNTIGKERGAMEEGHCDYMAKAYSRTYNDNTPNQVFSWDGFNPFFDGIDINTGKDYPEDLTGVQNVDRDVWSSALMCVHDYIGQRATDSLVLEHFFYQAESTSMAQMAKILLTIDSADFNRRYYSPLKQCLVDAGFVDRGAVAKPPQHKLLTILNSAGFSTGEAPAIIVLNSPGQWQLYNVAGQLVDAGKAERRIELQPSDYAKGVYILHLKVDNQDYSFKLVR